MKSTKSPVKLPARRLARVPRFTTSLSTALRIAAAGALGAAALALTASPATAEGASAPGGVMRIAAPDHPVRAGRTVRVSGDGRADDHAARYLRACVEERTGDRDTWHTVTCGATVASGTAARVEARVRARRPGTLQLRGTLYGLDGDRDPRPGPLGDSPVRTLRVR
ncbi:hypothetical protein [Streptomyces eurocidicus]|uniref:Uncharacterized protein n=1 Tax=Streptomyces eurocidicus TaxID=66423 RepID=A0A7W8F5X7_STREU|nr:hypothetical protein [Streptomyces eurocidicus]MBB5122390.1 hypothetical protein [Streptomyces eurocidicus]MBF6051674.1 hypothetical protein [Streptomyces eurocidicus]